MRAIAVRVLPIFLALLVSACGGGDSSDLQPLPAPDRPAQWTDFNWDEGNWE